MRRASGLLWGLLLIAGGFLLLLQNLGYLNNVSPYLWTALLAGAGAAFIIGYVLDRSRWWAIIPGIVLLGLSVVTFISTMDSPLMEQLSGAFFLGSVALAFWVVYIVRRDYWWAIIPAGVLTTLAVVAGLEDRTSGLASGGIFFIGLALTFLVVLLATRMQWAIFPALALGIMGVALWIGFGRVIDYIWPLALIAGGIYLLFRVWRPAR